MVNGTKNPNQTSSSETSKKCLHETSFMSVPGTTSSSRFWPPEGSTGGDAAACGAILGYFLKVIREIIAPAMREKLRVRGGSKRGRGRFRQFFRNKWLGGWSGSPERWFLLFVCSISLPERKREFKCRALRIFKRFLRVRGADLRA